jgi:hypothetical protein
MGTLKESDLEEWTLDSTELNLARQIFNSHEDGAKNEDEKAAPGRNPLYLALAVSPLYLLMPIQFLKASVGRKNLLNVRCLGPWQNTVY